MGMCTEYAYDSSHRAANIEHTDELKYLLKLHDIQVVDEKELPKDCIFAKPFKTYTTDWDKWNREKIITYIFPSGTQICSNYKYEDPRYIIDSTSQIMKVFPNG